MTRNSNESDFWILTMTAGGYVGKIKLHSDLI